MTVFLDLKGDDKPDPADPTATTDASGNYTFTGLHPGTYTVRQVLPDGYAATAPRGYSGTVTLGAGENAAGPNFGDVRISSVTLGFDYLLLIARNYGQAGTFADGDLNGDGRVDFDDLVLLARNYGHSVATGVGPTPGVSDDLLSLALRRRRGAGAPGRIIATTLAIMSNLTYTGGR